MHDDSFWGDSYRPNRQRSERTFDTAQICLNGHIANSSYNTHPQYREVFCSECGEKTITQCQSCNAPIRGAYERSLAHYQKPAYCINCGNPYPWTQRTQEAVYEIIEFSTLTQIEKDDFKNSITDLIAPSPKTNLAQLKFIKYAKNAGVEVAKGLKDVLIDIVSETAKKAIWGG